MPSGSPEVRIFDSRAAAEDAALEELRQLARRDGRPLVSFATGATYTGMLQKLHAEVGAVNRFTHIWAYPSLDARNETREKALAMGIWPPSALAKKEGLADPVLVAQENKIVMPAAFSPLQ